MSNVTVEKMSSKVSYQEEPLPISNLFNRVEVENNLFKDTNKYKSENNIIETIEYDYEKKLNELNNAKVEDLKAKIAVMKKRNTYYTISGFIFCIIFAFSIGLFAGSIYVSDSIGYKVEESNLKYQKDTGILNDKISELEEVIADNNITIGYAKKDNMDLSTEIKALNVELTNAIDIINENDTIISLYEQREELFDKYQHALYFGGKRTDITYDQLVFGINEMEERGLDPNLMFGLYKLETGFKEEMTSSLSSARGYGAFLRSSGKWVYEDLLEKGDYTHDMALDGYINMEMTAELLSYNMERYNGDVQKTLIAYNGGEIGDRYYQIIDKYLKDKGDSSIAQIQINYHDVQLSTNNGG